MRVEAVHCHDDLIVLCLSTPSGGLVQLRSASDPDHVLAQHVLTCGGPDAWSCLKNAPFYDGHLLCRWQRCFRLLDIRTGRTQTLQLALATPHAVRINSQQVTSSSDAVFRVWQRCATASGEPLATLQVPIIFKSIQIIFKSIQFV